MPLEPLDKNQVCFSIEEKRQRLNPAASRRNIGTFMSEHNITVKIFNLHEL